MISNTISKNKEFLEKFENISDPYESLSKISSINYEKLVQHQPLSPSDVSSLIIPSPEKLPYVCKVASMYRDSGKGKKITFSPKVFIPLTQLCKDKCGYCTFRKEPDNQEPYLSIDLLRNDDKKRILDDISENIGNKFASESMGIENIKNMLKPIPIMDQKPGLTFVELTKWMNSLRGFKIQDEAPYINKMFSQKLLNIHKLKLK